MSRATSVRAHDAVIARVVRDTSRWNDAIDSLLAAFGRRRSLPPALTARLEALRCKRDRVDTKIEALKRHRERGWERALDELEDARSELRDAWSTVLVTLEKQGRSSSRSA